MLTKTKYILSSYLKVGNFCPSVQPHQIITQFNQTVMFLTVDFSNRLFHAIYIRSELTNK